MKFTWHWLLDHLQTDKNINEIVDTLPKLGLEVASVINLADELKDFISVKVLEVKSHPNADKLNLCKVFDGNNSFNVVCGAPNVKAGMIGVFANINTYVPGINLTLKKTKIRGVSSEGMLCSEKELTLSDNHEGIIELPESSKIGVPIVDVMDLSDPIIEIEITPNRGDCLGVRGIARDLSAAGVGTLKDLEVKEIEGEFESLIVWKIDLEIEIEGNRLKISSEVAEDQETQFKKSFDKSFKIPSDINAESASATMKDGVLTIEFGKKAEAKKIKVA